MISNRLLNDKKISSRQFAIIRIIDEKEEVPASYIEKRLQNSSIQVSRPTVNRDLESLEEKNLILRKGEGKSTKYRVSKTAKILLPVDINRYFKSSSRGSVSHFNPKIFDLLSNISLLSKKEKEYLNKLKSGYQQKKSKLQKGLFRRELERLTIELSWKSSAIEGNTYDLLETEALLKQGIEADGKPKYDATMIINHKNAIDLIISNADKYSQLETRDIQGLHKVLVSGLGIGNDLRKSAVGISGSNYEPLENRGQIKKSLDKMCQVINTKNNEFEKALIAILLTAYIQPFVDGNKRMSRMLGNAILIASNSFPISYISVPVKDYQRSTILFYETNNAFHFKQLFLDQCKFAAEDYFKVSPPTQVN